MLELNTSGQNRWVVLTRRFAFKVPTPRSWRDFLFGLLNNMHEAKRSAEPGHCPVRFALPGGFLIVMPRARILTDDEFWSLNHAELPPTPERKADSFGWLGDKLVAGDYGW